MEKYVMENIWLVPLLQLTFGALLLLSTALYGIAKNSRKENKTVINDGYIHYKMIRGTK